MSPNAFTIAPIQKLREEERESGVESKQGAVKAGEKEEGLGTTPSGLAIASFALSRSFLSLVDDGRWTSWFLRSSPRNPAAVPVSL